MDTIFLMDAAADDCDAIKSFVRAVNPLAALIQVRCSENLVVNRRQYFPTFSFPNGLPSGVATYRNRLMNLRGILFSPTLGKLASHQVKRMTRVLDEAICQVSF